MAARFSSEEFLKLKDLLIIYNCALKTVLTKLDVLVEDYKNFQKNNPIEHIKSRLKAPESIADKLERKCIDITAQNAREKLTDIAGIRIICSFSKDIYNIVEIIRSQPDIRIIKEKDYVSLPKPSGYRSYHVIIEVPVYFSNSIEKVALELQIRTAAMDFWASLEHKVRYKYNEHIPKHLRDELVSCANKINNLDGRMFLIHDIIGLINPDE